MTTPFPFVAGAVLQAQQLNDITNLPINDQTANYVLVVGDAGKRVIMNAAGSTTITVNNSVFTTGDTIFIANKGAGTCTITAGTATVNTSGSLALAQYGGGTLVALSASTFTFFPAGGIGYGTATGGTSSSITVSGQNYTLLTMTSDTNLVVSKTGLFEVLLIGGGGGGGGATNTNGCGGGGGGGGILGLDETLTVYLAAGTYTVDVGAGGAGSTSYNNAGNPSLIGQSLIVYGGGRGASYAQTTSSAEPNNQGTLFRVGGAGANSGGHATTSAYADATFSNGGNRRIGLGVINNTYYGGNGVNDMAVAESNASGGGGGAGGNGGNAVSNTGGAGGNGRDISSWITGATYYAGAGGGGGANSTGGAAGNGGVAGVTSGTGNNGVNYGAAGGGARNGAGGNGTAGVVYVRFKV